MKKNIVFDVDRTLIDSFMSELLSLKEAIKLATGKLITDEELHKLTILPTKVFFQSIGLTMEDVKIVNKHWEVLIKKYKTECFPNLALVIKELDKRGYYISIITSRTLEEFHELDNALKDIINIFKVIVTSDLVNKHKPSRDSMDYLCNKLNCNSNEVIYIGDSYIDLEFARNSGCEFIPACWENKELINEVDAITEPIKLLDIFK